MKHKINHLKNISQKSKIFFQFLNFVGKKIIPLQMLNGSSVFAIYSCLENSTLSKARARINIKRSQRCGLVYLNVRVVEYLKADKVGSLFWFQTRCYFVLLKVLTQTTLGQQIASIK